MRYVKYAAPIRRTHSTHRRSLPTLFPPNRYTTMAKKEKKNHNVSHPPLLISASSFLEMKLGTPWLSHKPLSIES